MSITESFKRRKMKRVRSIPPKFKALGDSSVIEVVVRFSFFFLDCSLHYFDSKCEIKKIGHQDHLGEITCSSYSYLIIATSSIKDKFVPSVHATFRRNRKHSFDVILEITQQVYCIVQKEKFNAFFMAQTRVMKRH